MDITKLDTYSEQWRIIEEKIGGECGKSIVEALKQLYSIYDSRMIEWMAGLYDPESGAWYHSKSGQRSHGYGPDAESTIEVFQFWEETGMTGGKPYATVTPTWLKKKVTKFCYDLQDPDGYFYHPQWGKQYYIDNNLDSRRSRDSEWCERLIRLFSDGTLKYSLPGENLKAGGEKASCVPEKWRSIEKYKEYLYGLDLKYSSYPVGNTLLAESPERNMYGKALGADLNQITVDWLNDNVSPVTGLWQAENDTSYSAVNALCKITLVYNKAGKPLGYPVEGIRSSMASILSDERAGAVTDTLNPWSSIANGLYNIRFFSQGGASLADEMLREVRQWAPKGIIKTAEKLTGFKMSDGGMSYLLSGCCPTSQGAPVAVPGACEGDINGNCCASCAVVKYIFKALGLEDVMIPLFDYEDLKRFLDIVEAREAEWQTSKSSC